MTGDAFTTGNLIGGLVGTLYNSNQPYVTSLGTLTSLNVAGDINSGNLITGNITTTANTYTGNVIASGTLYANSIVISSGSGAGNISTANIQTGNITATGNITTGANIIAPSIIAGNLSVYGISITSGTLNLGTGQVVAGPFLGTTLTVGTGTFSDPTDSFTPTTGAVQIIGGVGIGANLNVGGNVRITNALTLGGNITANGGITAGGAAGGWTPSTIAGLLSLPGNQNGQVIIDASNAGSPYSTYGFLFANTIVNMQFATSATTVNIGASTGNTTVNNDLRVSGNLYGNLQSTTGNVILNSNLYVANTFTVSGNTTLGSITGANASLGNVVINGLTTAVYANTGALQVAGGVGVIGSLQVGAQNNTNANVTVWNISNASNLNNGALIVKGGSAIGANLQIGGVANVWSTTQATGNVTGALMVAGGASIAKNTYIGGDLQIYGGLTISGAFTVGTFSPASLNATPIGNATPSTGVFSTLAVSQLRPASSPSFKFDFANNPVLDPRITYSRNSQATYTNNNGILTISANNLPRFHYDYQSNPLGLLIEESRQNLYLYSNQFTNAAQWTTANATLNSSSGSISPDGTANAYRIVEDSTNNTHGIAAATGTFPTVTSTSLYTASVFAKAGSRTQISMVFDTEGTATVFDLYNGVVSSEGASYRSSMESYANGWYRLSSTVQKTNTRGNVLIALASGGSYTYTGSGSGYADVYGFQFEPGSFATSYIPTTTVANIRLADNVAVTGSYFSSFYQGTLGSFLVDAKLSYRPTTLVPTTRAVLVSFDDTTAGNRVQVQAETTLQGGAPFRGANLVAVYNGNYTTLGANISNPGNLITTSSGKVSGYFTSNSFAVSVNANTAASTSLGLLSNNFVQLSIGSGPGANYLNGTVSKFMYYGTLVTQVQAVELSRQ
jgi:hypothetical protein